MFEFSLMQSTSYVVPEVNCPNSFNLDPLNKGSERNVPAGDGTDTATRSASFATGTVCGPARRPHFSLAIISVTVQLWT